MTAALIEPISGAVIDAGGELVVNGYAEGPDIVRVTVVLDTETHALRLAHSTTLASPRFTVSAVYVVRDPGEHALQLLVYGAEDRLLAQTATVHFRVVPPATPSSTATSTATTTRTPTPTPTPTHTPQPTETPQPPTPTPTASSTPTPTSAPTAITCVVIVSRASVRNGPGSTYRTLGMLLYGNSIAVYDHSVNGQWLQIAYGQNSTDRGWLLAKQVRCA